MDSDAGKPWIVWTQYPDRNYTAAHYWLPQGFDSEREAIDWAEDNRDGGARVLTRRRVLASRDAEGSE